MKKSLIIRFFGIGAAILLIGGVFVFLRQGDNGTQEASPQGGSPRWGGGGAGGRSVSVIARPITQDSIQEIGRFTGTLLPSRRITVAAKAPGLLEELLVNIGDPVESGQLLGRIDRAEILEEVNQAKAELEVAKANALEAESALELARRDLDRIESLRTQDFVTAAEIEVAEARVREREARVQVTQSTLALREASLRRTNIRLSNTELRATWSNPNEIRFVSRRFLDEGSLLSMNQAVLEIVSLNNLIGQFFVTENEFYRIERGQSVRITVSGLPGEPVQGIIARLSPQFSEESRRALIEVNIPNESLTLNPGVFARFEATLREMDLATVIPRDAIVRRENQEGVFLINQEDSNVRFVTVQRLFAEGQQVAVEGLPEEGLVVILGQERLVDRTPVTWSTGNPAETALRGQRTGSNQRQRPSN